MTPFDLLLIKAVEQTRRDLASPTAPTMAIMARIPLAVPDRTLRHYLRNLEQNGYVTRPKGPKSGWALTLPMRQALRAA